MLAKFAVGIDLGTTNTLLAYAPLDAESPQIEVLPIPQLVAAGTLEPHAALPSFAYLAAGAEAGGATSAGESTTAAREARPGPLDVPWQSGRDFAVGEWARRQAADAPTRTVAAAKSWLCHGAVDRRQPILPWNAPPEVQKISPVTASRWYLEHLVAAWQTSFPDAPIAQQHVVLTVPASFDASARELTREAALAAGLPDDLVLLEEPQAAVYCWLSDVGDRWRRILSLGDKLLVCDVGGGTTDLTLVAVVEEHGELALRRLAVGNHLLVGGDNMDLALAHHAAALFAAKGVQLDPWQSVALWHSCRTAKETLLAAEGPTKHSIGVLGRGRKMIGGAISVEVDRQSVGDLLVDGFLPQCKLSDRPARRRASGFQEIGLPFESDTAITRHLAAFLAVQGDAASPARPTHVLLGGGAFKAEVLRRRLLDVLDQWFAEGQQSSPSSSSSPRLLEGAHDLDRAVARGAAYYAWTRRHGGVRIRGGAGRAYYVGIETSGLAVPGAPRPLRALCVVPIGMEEGTESDVPSGEIGLVVGEPAQFRFFSSAVRKTDRPGTLLDAWSKDELSETDPMQVTLEAVEGIDEPYVPVRFQSRITELGVLELWCVAARIDRRWKLEFSVRDDAPPQVT